MTGATSLSDRARASLVGLALGDALGMPTQSLSLDTIRSDHGRVTAFLDAGPHQRIAAGMRAGTVTDDTEQALLLADVLLEGDGRVDPEVFARRLVEWERRMLERGSLDLLGPSTRAAVQRLLEGVPVEEAGSGGTTNGAAMRIAPVGIATPSGDLDALVDAVEAASALTHNTGLGIAGASAVAAAISAGLDGATVDEALDLAVEAARLGARRGTWVSGGDIASRLVWVREWLPRVPADERLDALFEVVGTSVASQESVVAALGLAALEQDPWVTLGDAASVGGDTDTIAAMAGAVLGAVHGQAAWPGAAVYTVTRVNGLDLGPVVDGLLALRLREGGEA
ncbi:ADP-ribosyl-[dinitrogen reductase] glycohydrolase [Frondihabitans sp. 762G35]|uniref:ADP-ribosylglycohydrolase family protein n=1 Tax=Frondihabitans sp. 762G35 TaxID=1446794 RepID=UPI000D213B99|nr:ADP-ribosylglycohydrolase family protein [Frondihabitans sp. 762G35]ARC57712.1 ADP-ribosyl-[dinitrogen reductase] glycohydrolase [Frondihabitans sp. 762G35]